MNYAWDFFIQNYALLCISLVIYIIAIQRFKQHGRISLYTILVVSSAILLAISETIQYYAKENNNLLLTIICGIFGYSSRPVCIYFLIMMTKKNVPTKYLWLTFMPLVLNFTIYLFALLPNTGEIIFGYYIGGDGKLTFSGGPLRFSSHIISALYLMYFLYTCIAGLRAKHMGQSIAILTCLTFVVVVVIIESFFNPNGDIHLLNVTIVICALVYYIFLFMEASSIDTLTGLFNRETYYKDTLKMEKTAMGIIQFDMNGLKYINDNYGHLEGDKALATIAHTITKSIGRSMYAYRLGGDEYIVIANSCKEQDLINAVDRFKVNLYKTKYHCSIGYSYRKNKNMTFDEMIKESEKKMYLDKEEFYKNSNIERRKAEKV